MENKKLNGIFDVAINEEITNGKRIFVSHCLNLGIASQDYSYEESLENIKDTIKLYLEECPEKLTKKQEDLLPPYIRNKIILNYIVSDKRKAYK